MADTIEIVQGTATVVEVAGPTGPQGPAGAAGATGAQGPQGVPGTGLEVLTTQGDILYQGASTGQRLPIGTTGQVLKVAGGIPAWANESGAVTSVNGATGAVTVAAAQHASEHEPSSPDTIYAFAALVTTDVVALNGVYFCDGATTVGGKDVFFKTGTRKNTKLQYNNSTLRWNLVANLTIEAESSEDAYSEPWGQGWIGLATPTTVSVTRLPLETMVQRLAETGGTATATTSEDGLMSSADKTKLNGIAAGAEVNVQANWTEADSGSDAFILNKPSTFAPSAHSSSHAVGGSDPLFDQDLNTTDNVAFEGLRVVSAASQTVAKQVLVADDEGLIVGITGNEADARASLGLGDAATADIGTAAGEVAEGNHTHGNLTNDGKLGSTSGLPLVTTTAGAVTTLALGTAGQVLTVNSGATGVEFAAASGGGVTAVGASTADVFSVSGSDLVADDGGTIDSSDPFIKWDDAAGKLVYANPLSRPSGAMYVGLAPSTTALGSNAINVQATRTNAADVASGSASICIGTGSIRASGNESIAMGVGGLVNALRAVGIGYAPSATGTSSVCVTGLVDSATGVNSAGINGSATLRAQFATRPFSAIYWSGQTTNNTATILNLDGTATNRFTIAASTALAVDILLVARRATTQDKWLVARRFLGIRRDGSNNTALIGSVQTLGTDQSAGSPTWTFALTADDTNEALQLEVTGATGETVEWRATAFYRVA